MIDDRYLGDGVYASFDGYHTWLDTRAQSPVNRIALEPPVIAELKRFISDAYADATVDAGRKEGK